PHWAGRFSWQSPRTSRGPLLRGVRGRHRLGDVVQRLAGALGSRTHARERLGLGQAVALHQEALSPLDDLAGGERLAQRVGPGPVEHGPKIEPDDGLVLGDQDAIGNLATAFPPRSARSSSCPASCSRTSVRAIVMPRPSPVPGAGPLPASVTVSSTWPFWCRN